MKTCSFGEGLVLKEQFEKISREKREKSFFGFFRKFRDEENDKLIMENVCSGRMPIIFSYLAKEAYFKNRLNGDDGDSPQQEFPWDGQVSWRVGDNNEYLLIRYDEGELEREWMEERDRNYVRRKQKEEDKKRIQAAVATRDEQKRRQETATTTVGKRAAREQHKHHGQEGNKQKRNAVSKRNYSFWCQPKIEKRNVVIATAALLLGAGAVVAARHYM